MKIYRVGDTQKAICDLCESLESVTFKLRDVPFNDGSGMVKNVLVGVCDQCNEVCLLPHQSTPAVRTQLEAHRKPVESRLPAHLIDILSLAAEQVGGSTDFVPALIKFYIHRLAADKAAAQKLAGLLASDLARGKADKRLSIKGRQVVDDLSKLQASTRICNKTDLIKGVILRINEDILLRKRPDSIAELKNVLAAVA